MMKRAKIDVVTRRGTFTTPSGVKMWKFLVTMDDNADGMVFAGTDKPWWKVGDYVWYTITGYNNGVDHFKFQRNNTMRLAPTSTTPGTRARPDRETWMWAIATAASVQLQPMTRPTPEFWADVEADAIRLHMMLDKLETL